MCQVEGRGRSCVISNARDPLNLLSCQGTVLGSGTSRCHQRLQGPPAGGAPGWTAKLPVHRERASKALGGEESVQKHRETGVSKLGPRLPALKCWGDKGEMAKEGRLLRREKEGEGSGGHTEGACTHVTRIGQHAPNDKTLGHRSRVLGAVGRRPEWGGGPEGQGRGQRLPGPLPATPTQGAHDHPSVAAAVIQGGSPGKRTRSRRSQSRPLFRTQVFLSSDF